MGPSLLALVTLVLGLLAASPVSALAQAVDPGAPAEPAARALDLFAQDEDVRSDALAYFERRGQPDALPALIQARRFASQDQSALQDVMVKLAGEDPGESWFDWMRWLQAHPEIEPFDGFDALKASLYARIDPDFVLFLHPGVAHEIRLEEVVWGGVHKDGIPALTNPRLIEASAAQYLQDDELVFGIEINGDARAYPLRIMDWHEMFNDVIGGAPVSLAYCTLCGSGILFETTVEGRDAPFIFGSSGFLYRSNKLMYDQATHSLWNQFTGRPVVGPLTGSGIELKTRPVVITSWGAWREDHPDTRVLSLDTGHPRDYRPGRPYGDYFASPELMFPALVSDESLEPKDYVFALRGSTSEHAWPLSRFEGGAVINDRAGVVPLVLIGDAATRSVRAYRRPEETVFRPGVADGTLELGGEVWQISEEALIGPNGQALARLPGHVAYWFAWSGYLGDEGDLAAGS
ncbi:MAG: DUF3179 domain-containing protein [Geminicoccaceae bacterium]